MALYGVYGRHTTEMCPLNNIETAKTFVTFAETDLEPKTKEFKINKILAQYHSGLEHTFLWVVDGEDPHLIQKFFVVTGVASFNELKTVPIITFREDIIPLLKQIHSL